MNVKVRQQKTETVRHFSPYSLDYSFVWQFLPLGLGSKTVLGPPNLTLDLAP